MVQQYALQQRLVQSGLTKRNPKIKTGMGFRVSNIFSGSFEKCYLLIFTSKLLDWQGATTGHIGLFLVVLRGRHRPPNSPGHRRP